MNQVIASPNAPKAVGPYSQAQLVPAGSQLLFISGQLPINPADGQMPESIQDQTRQSMSNLSQILAEAGMSFDDVVKTTVLLADIADFKAMNEVYAEFFPAQKPARVCYQVAALPMGAKVEIDATAAK